MPVASERRSGLGFREAEEVPDWSAMWGAVAGLSEEAAVSGDSAASASAGPRGGDALQRVETISIATALVTADPARARGEAATDPLV